MVKPFVGTFALAVAVSTLAAGANAIKVCVRDAVPLVYGMQSSFSGETVTEQQCIDACAASTTVDCAAYTFVAGTTTGGVCLLTSVYDASARIGFPTAGASTDAKTGRCGTQLPALKGDFPGNDLANAAASDALRCNFLCEDTRGCQAYSWTNYNGGTCWMKTARSDALAGPFDGSVVSGEVFTCKASAANTDIVGEDLANVQRANWRECCGVCRRTKGCAASSWNNYNGGTCWLKKTNTGTKTASGVVSVTVSV